MKSKVNLSIEVKPIPVIMQDKKNGYYEIHYQGFPHAVGKGKTKQEAELNLIETFIVLLKERSEKIREKSINNYYTD
jgi:predicted RNase H-like HicB family nuclease